MGREEEQGSGGVTREGATMAMDKMQEERKKQREGRTRGGGRSGRGREGWSAGMEDYGKGGDEQRQAQGEVKREGP
jgi:hypothetical protein